MPFYYTHYVTSSHISYDEISEIQNDYDAIDVSKFILREIDISDLTLRS